MFRQAILLILTLGLVSPAVADTFGTGANQFTIDFVNISGDTGNLGSWPADSDYTFSGVNHGNYRMGTYEITNDQWNKFKNSLSVPVKGNPFYAYGSEPFFSETNVPTNNASWYEAAQFINWLNTSTGYQAAYKFTGTQGTSSYSLGVWQPGETGYNASNPFRNSNAFYFLPTEDEWVKAAYWNGISLQTYATTYDTLPVEDIDANYAYEAGAQPWIAGSGKIELNGTFDMMGNMWEWMESPYSAGNYTSDSTHGLRGGSYTLDDYYIRSSARLDGFYYEQISIGFRVASVPEPISLLLLGLGGVMIWKRKI